MKGYSSTIDIIATLSVNIRFLNNTGPDPLKSQIYEASIQNAAIIGIPGTDNGPLIIELGASLLSSPKSDPLTKYSRSAHWVLNMEVVVVFHVVLSIFVRPITE